MVKTDWNKSRFKKLVRITEEDLNWIKKQKGKKSSAGFLEAIIKFVKKNGNESL